MSTERVKLEDCKCFGWGRCQPLWETHHKNCEHYDPVADVLEMVNPLLAGIESWAHDEDGEVHPDLWEAYKRARLYVGRRLPAEQREETA